MVTKNNGYHNAVNLSDCCLQLAAIHGLELLEGLLSLLVGCVHEPDIILMTFYFYNLLTSIVKCGSITQR